MIGLVFAVASTLATEGVLPPKDCYQGSTLAVNACLQAEAEGADEMLAQYLEAARVRLKHEAKDSPCDTTSATALAGLDKAEAAWVTYRKAECDAVYDWWSSGSVRGAMLEGCWIRLTKLHTHTLWREWLTFVDNTPPILPEPPVPSKP